MNSVSEVSAVLQHPPVQRLLAKKTKRVQFAGILRLLLKRANVARLNTKADWSLVRNAYTRADEFPFWARRALAFISEWFDSRGLGSNISCTAGNRTAPQTAVATALPTSRLTAIGTDSATAKPQDASSKRRSSKAFLPMAQALLTAYEGGNGVLDFGTPMLAMNSETGAMQPNGPCDMFVPEAYSLTNEAMASGAGLHVDHAEQHLVLPTSLHRSNACLCCVVTPSAYDITRMRNYHAWHVVQGFISGPPSELSSVRVIFVNMECDEDTSSCSVSPAIVVTVLRDGSVHVGVEPCVAPQPYDTVFVHAVAPTPGHARAAMRAAHAPWFANLPECVVVNVYTRPAMVAAVSATLGGRAYEPEMAWALLRDAAVAKQFEYSAGWSQTELDEWACAASRTSSALSPVDGCATPPLQFEGNPSGTNLMHRFDCKAWSLQELLCAASLHRSHTGHSVPSDAAVRAMFEKWGGLADRCLQSRVPPAAAVSSAKVRIKRATSLVAACMRSRPMRMKRDDLLGTVVSMSGHRLPPGYGYGYSAATVMKVRASGDSRAL